MHFDEGLLILDFENLLMLVLLGRAAAKERFLLLCTSTHPIDKAIIATP